MDIEICIHVFLRRKYTDDPDIFSGRPFYNIAQGPDRGIECIEIFAVKSICVIIVDLVRGAVVYPDSAFSNTYKRSRAAERS